MEKLIESAHKELRFCSIHINGVVYNFSDYKNNNYKIDIENKYDIMFKELLGDSTEIKYIYPLFKSVDKRIY